MWQRDALDNGLPGSFPLLERHLARLRASSGFFSFPFPARYIRETLTALSMELRSRCEEEGKGIGAGDRFKVRCTLDASGSFTVNDVSRLPELPTPVQIDISLERVDPEDRFLYHKTSRRELFNSERRRLQAAGLFETLFLNTSGEVTQGTISNLFVDVGTGQLLTPALSCGLLPGVLRQELLDDGRAIEAVLTEKDLLNADALYIGNSVRGLMEARLTGCRAG